nr:ribonuclease H-like domain-containing protein [Tanacetum cinerariifolium]
MRPFGCPVTILNTLDSLGKFDGKADEGFLVGYSVSSGPTWLFDIDTLTQFMNYQPFVAGNQPNSSAGIQEKLDADPQNTDVDVACDDKENESAVHVSLSSSNKPRNMMKRLKEKLKERVITLLTAVGSNSANSTNSFNVAGPSDNVVSPSFEIGGKSSFVDPSQYPDDPNMPALEDIVYSYDEEDVGAEADFSNLETIK